MPADVAAAPADADVDNAWPCAAVAGAVTPLGARLGRGAAFLLDSGGMMVFQLRLMYVGGLGMRHFSPACRAELVQFRPST